MTVVITPVGTSLFTNGAEEYTDIRDLFADIRYARAYDWDDYSDYTKELRKASERFINGAGVTASAELQSTSAIHSELTDNIKVHLIASDTIASRLAAEVLKDQLPQQLSVDVKFNPNDDIIQGLCATDPNHFETLGVYNLLNRLKEICSNFQDDQTLAINITGGYAATVSLLTLFAQEKQYPLYYNFEETSKLIEILRYFP